MNAQFLHLLAILATAAGSFLLGGGLGDSMSVPGAGLLLAGLCCGVLGLLSGRRSVLRFRRFCAEASPENVTPPALAAPLDLCVAAAAQRFASVFEELAARTSDARRARMTARAAEEELKALRSLIDNLADAVVLVEPGGVPVLANRAARQLLGLPLDGGELRDSDIRVTCPLPALKTVLDEAVKGESRDSRDTRDVDCSDRTQRLVLRVSFQRVAPAESASAADANLAILLRDVTREVELNRMKSDFASSVSHELKTPLCSMRAFLEMLLDGDIEGEAEQRAHMQMVLDETDRLTRLVQNLLNLSRLESGVTKMSRDAVDLRGLLSHLEEVVRPLADARRQTLNFELSDYLPSVTGDFNLLEQALMNLVSNAIKYTPEAGSVMVRAALSGREVEIAVRDTGVGIPQKALGLVFEKFTRVENHAGLKATGTGLGLPLARFVADAHTGRITVESEVGKGSTFTMYLPARRAEESAEEQLVGLEGITG